MIDVFWKEIRENAKWAGAIFGVIVMVVYWQMRRHNPYLMFGLAEQPMLVFVPLAGVLMGVVQTLFETKMDNWAFVVHRPVSRGGVFAAKCAAGLVLLFLALELPCLIASGWAARPGNLRMPFGARMVLPTLALVLSAGCYYFVGMLLTLRNARWWGTRVLPVGFAVSCSLGVWIAPEFWEALAIVLVGCGVGAAAAWGAFATGGAMDRGVVSGIGLGAMIGVGVVAIGVGMVGLMGIFQSTQTWAWWRLERDGNVLRVVTTVNGNERTSEVTDAAGKRVAELSGVDLDDPAYADRFVRFTGGLLDERKIPWPYSTVYYGDGYRQPERGVVGLPKGAKAGVRMRAGCVYDVAGRVIEMYEPESRALIGRVGPGGFVSGGGAVGELFPGKLLNPSQQRNTHALAFESGVYWMELDRRRVRKIFTAEAEDPVVAVTEVAAESKAGETKAGDPTVIVGTRRKIYVMRPSGEVISTAGLERELGESFYSVAMLPGNHHVVIWEGSMSPTEKRHPVILELSGDREAKVLRRTETPAFELMSKVALPRTAMLGVVCPAAAIGVSRYWQWSWLLDLGVKYEWMFYGWLAGASLAWGVLAGLLARRYGVRKWGILIWMGVGLAFGVGGIAGLVGVNEMPAGEKCGVCGGVRWVGRRKCPKCEAAVAPAEAEGWEVFEPVGSVVV